MLQHQAGEGLRGPWARGYAYLGSVHEPEGSAFTGFALKSEP